MISLPIIGLMVGFATLGQGQAEMPEAWKQKIEAAAKAEKSGDRIAAEVLLIELVREGEKFGKRDLRLGGATRVSWRLLHGSAKGDATPSPSHCRAVLS